MNLIAGGLPQQFEHIAAVDPTCREDLNAPSRQSVQCGDAGSTG
jgi:hypothetical protein